MTNGTTGTNGRKKLPLEGLRILDITVVWAGPYGTMHLADWGAEVIRIESTSHFATSSRGTMARPPKAMVALRAGGMGYPDDEPGERPWNRNAIFNTHARHKKSVTLDMTVPEGQEIFERLIKNSDGLIENNVAISMERLGVTWERLSEINPRLILIRQPAFGIEGPYKNYRTWGNHMEALAGHPLLRTYPNEDPARGPSGVPSDAAGGIGGALAFLMGLRYRNKTGKGVMIEAPTAENFIPLMGEFVMDYTMNGRVHTQLGNQHPYFAPHQAYRCKDAEGAVPGETERWVTIVCRSDAEFQALCGIMEAPGLALDARFSGALERWKHRSELDALVSQWTSDKDPSDLAHRLQDAGIAAGMIMNERDVLNDPHVKERGFFQEVTHPEAGTHQNPTYGVKLSKTPNEIRRHAVLLGQDNEYVYKEVAGHSDDEYKHFVETGMAGMDYAENVS
ncbi:MAG: CoA transferase [Dehalococcoidia bacterium]|jgi:crotonobetainyl-CoA:carnitine CoA-transferase CaiB-like acyl-CoA transferase|nr:CoA transferase [Dehalococcoidia bacterium]